MNRVGVDAAHADAAIDFNVGIDIESVSRFGPDANEAAVLRLFATEEVAQCSGLKDGPSRLAGIWCAKEATVKALSPWVRLDPRRVRVFGAADRRPQVVVNDWSPQEHHVGDPSEHRDRWRHCGRLGGSLGTKPVRT